MRQRDVCFVGLALAMALTACSHKGEGKGEGEELPSVKISEVRAVGGQVTAEYPGRVKAGTDATLSFKVGGTVASVKVKEGQHVSKGQLLAELDATDYEVQLRAAEAEYRQVKAEAERVMALYADSGVSANAYDKAKYGLEQIEAKYKHCKDELEYTRLYAPYDGQVQARLSDAHETVGAGTPILTIVGSGTPEVEINISATDYMRRADFEAYECSFDICPGVNLPLRPIGIAPKANANQLYTMRLALDAEGHTTLPSPGMSTTVRISLRDKGEEGETLLSVPVGALVEEDGATRLFLFNAKDSTAHSARVSVKELRGDGTAILSSTSLGAGDAVVSSGAHHIKDGQKVRPLHESATNVGGLL